MSDISKQLRKGVLEILVLHLISCKPQYGYVLLQELRELSGGVFDLKEGTLYPILYRLEDEQLVESYWVETEGRGLPKKYYRTTKSGQKQASNAVTIWKEFSQAVDETLGISREHLP